MENIKVKEVDNVVVLFAGTRATGCNLQAHCSLTSLL